ncbi:MAG: M3 family oligoendopeptidase [Nitrososphaerales archaeon]
MTQTLEETKKYADGVRWSLSDVLPSTEGKIFTTFLEQLEGMIIEFESTRAKLVPSISVSEFLSVLESYEHIVRMRARLGSYAYMYFSEDTRSQNARTFKARAEEVDTDAENRTLFFELWWKNLEIQKSNELLQSSGAFNYFLQKLQKTKPFTLKEEVEKVINLKYSTGRTAILQLYHQIRDSFGYEIKFGSETRRLTEEELRDLFHSPVRDTRKKAYESLMGRFKENTDVFGEIYKTLVRDWRNEGVKLRKYSSPISIRNLSNDVPDEAVDVLLSVCKKNATVFQDFFKLKAKLLQISDFARYDVYAPLPDQKEKTYTWEEGVKTVLSTFTSFNEGFSILAHNVISASHVDAEPRQGKLGGAYCMSITPDIVPYVLTSYTGKARSVSTVAHELGHAVHSQLAAKSAKNQLTFEAPLPLAETASVFAEMLLMDRMVMESDEITKRSLLVEMLDDAYATIGRQAFFVLFENLAHERVAQGINVDDLSNLYLENLRSQFGSSLEVQDYFKYEWNVIPHIYQSPFYCYAYAWGNLLVLALYKQFREEGPKTFAPRYMKILSYGGSASPEKILCEAGFDIRSESFWQSGFDELSRSVIALGKVV